MKTILNVFLIFVVITNFLPNSMLFSYANLFVNASITPGNWNGSFQTDRYGSRTCKQCHSSGSGINLEIKNLPTSLLGNEEIEITVSLADGYNPPYHPQNGSIMGMYLMGYDSNNNPVSIEDAGWIIIDDPNSNTDDKYNYNEKPSQSDLSYTWILKASHLPGDYKIKAYSFVGNNDKATSADYTIEVMPGSINSNEKLIESFNLTSYPNPFNPASVISFDILKKQNDDRSHVVLGIYDNSGRKVSSLINGQLKGGNHKIKFDGSMFESGVYFVKLSVDNKVVVSNRMLLLK